jgi:hypothetical protein
MIIACHMLFQSEKALRQHFTQVHAAYMVDGWEAKLRRLVQRWSEPKEDTEESGMTGERNEAEEVGRQGERGQEH